MIEITESNPVIPDHKLLIDCGEGAYGLGNNFTVDWERFYEMLETYGGYDMQDLGGKADNKIRRIVRKAIREGEIT